MFSWVSTFVWCASLNIKVTKRLLAQCSGLSCLEFRSRSSQNRNFWIHFWESSPGERMILTLRCWLTCKLLTRNLWFMKFVWPGNWTPGPGPESLPSSLTSPSPSLITSLRTFPRVKSLRDLRFNASFHHITHTPVWAPLTLHLMTYKIVWDYWNAFQKSKIFCRQIISTKDTQIET